MLLNSSLFLFKPPPYSFLQPSSLHSSNQNSMERGRVHDEIVPIEVKVIEAEKKTAEMMMMKKKSSSPSVAGQVAQVLLRSLTALCMLAAIAMMLFFTEETFSIGGYMLTANYRFSPTFQFFVIGCGVAGLYSILCMPFVYCCPRSRFLHGLDMMVMAIAMAAFSAATAVGYIGLFGNDAIGWMKVCNYVERFCSHSTIALGLSFVGFVVHFFVCTLSSA